MTVEINVVALLPWIVIAGLAWMFNQKMCKLDRRVEDAERNIHDRIDDVVRDREVIVNATTHRVEDLENHVAVLTESVGLAPTTTKSE